MLNALLVAPVRIGRASGREGVGQAVSMGRLQNVATPPEALAVRVPPRVPPPVLVSMAIVIEAVLVTVLPPASWTVTWTAGLMLTPATALLGGVVNASLAAGPTEMLNALLVAPV